MRWFVLGAVLAIAAGCGKKVAPTPTEPTRPAPSDTAFAEDSPENTLSWLAAQRNALNPGNDQEGGEKFKALVETMKGRSINWPGKLAQPNPDKTCGLLAFTLNVEPPGPKSAEAREWHYAIFCKPLEPGVQIREDAPFARKYDVGFPLASNWQGGLQAGEEARLTGKIAAVQLHRKSWVTGYGAQDRVVHTEVAVTLHIADGTLSRP